ncbi:MAG: DNA sulfur modification protein DndB [Thiocapsa sp. C3-sup]|uniref:DNA sulfur modification protein DndB n=1 Tax=unclassified Thiocapsa TaxID=2641286 RepID=UPI0035AEDA74
MRNRIDNDSAAVSKVRKRPTSRQSTPTQSAEQLTTFIEFSAIRGTQAGRPQYAAIWPVGMLIRLSAESLSRMSRRPSEPIDARLVGDLAERCETEPERLFNQPILLGVLGRLEFLPTESAPNMGVLRLDPAARIEILDGLHRLAAITQAGVSDDQLADLSAAILISPIRELEDVGKRRRALTKCAGSANTGKARRLERKAHREQIARDSVTLSPFLTKAVDLKQTTIAPRSRRLFTVKTYARACRPFVEARRESAAPITAEQLAGYWQLLADTLPDWQGFTTRRIGGGEVREKTVLANAGVLRALGRLGARVLAEPPAQQPKLIARLAGVDWRRDSPAWQGTLVADGKIRTGSEIEDGVYLHLLKVCRLAAEG